VYQTLAASTFTGSDLSSPIKGIVISYSFFLSEMNA
jgi:hypothetical protein